MQLNDLSAEDFRKLIEKIIDDKKEKTSVKLINREAVAKRLHVSFSTLWRWSKSGYLRAIKYGRAVWYLLEEIEAFERGERNVTEDEGGR